MAEITKTTVVTYTLNLAGSEMSVIYKLFVGLDLTSDETQIMDELISTFNAGAQEVTS